MEPIVGPSAFGWLQIRWIQRNSRGPSLVNSGPSEPHDQVFTLKCVHIGGFPCAPHSHSEAHVEMGARRLKGGNTNMCLLCGNEKYFSRIPCLCR